jgi:hypothetical protein
MMTLCDRGADGKPIMYESSMNATAARLTEAPKPILYDSSMSAMSKPIASESKPIVYESSIAAVARASESKPSNMRACVCVSRECIDRRNCSCV